MPDTLPPVVPTSGCIHTPCTGPGVCPNLVPSIHLLGSTLRFTQERSLFFKLCAPPSVVRCIDPLLPRGSCVPADDLKASMIALIVRASRAVCRFKAIGLGNSAVSRRIHRMISCAQTMPEMATQVPFPGPSVPARCRNLEEYPKTWNGFYRPMCQSPQCIRRGLAAKPQGGLMRRLMPQRTSGDFRNGLQQLS
jgi:hypothetical protein